MRQQAFSIRPLTLALAAAGILLHTQTEASDAALLDTVNVTATSQEPAAGDWSTQDSRAATKTTTPLNELAQSVSVVSREQIEALRPVTVAQALNYAPGAYAGLFGSATRYDYVALRGFVDTSMANTVLDGMRLMSDAGAFSAFQIDPYFIDRIDLVRGPISVLYGNAAPGGMVALMSKRPQQQAEREIRLDVGANNERGFAFDFTGGLSAEWSYRLTGLTRAADSMQNHAKEERQALMPQLMWKPNADTALLLQAYLQRDPEGGFHSGTPFEGSVTSHAGKQIAREFYDGEPGNDQFDRRQNMFGYQFEHRFAPAWQVRQNLRYTDGRSKLEQVYQSGWASDTELSRGYSFSEEHLKGLAVDTRVQGSFGTGILIHDLIAGIDYQTRENTGYWGWGSATNIDAFNPVYGQATLSKDGQTNFVRKFSQLGYYLQDQVSLGGWRFTGGLRYDRATTSSHDPDTKSTTEWDGGEWSRRLGALYLFDNGIAPYVSYSESFDPTSNTDINGKVLQPTRGTQYEAGLKYQPHPGLLLTAAVYDLEQKNVGRMVPGQSYFEPVGTVQSRGLELEAQWSVTKALYVQAAYTRNQMKIKNGAPEAEGKRPRQSPEQMASAWVNYTPLEGARLGLGIRHIGKNYADIANTMTVPSATLVDLSASVELGRWSSALKGAALQLSASNLFDKDYVAACYDETYCYFGNGRTVTGTLKYSW
ncbi:TonB-dependent siderophore receptor [Chitinibacter tainanensis]|uniref:TonB-dependent siderophore receptor n=1 Tax=Chitinibacter tainanensis TaxID=230667 RepID=UPI0003F501F4|nr:TonB-dependent siderophore receptor [Chitinibacter tainanensis]